MTSTTSCNCGYCTYLRSIIAYEESKLQVYRDELKRNHLQFQTIGDKDNNE